MSTWPARLYGSALDAGFLFSVPQVGKTLKPLVDRFGEEEVGRVWAYYVANVLELGTEDAKWIGPISFARGYAYWRRLASPVGS